MAAFLDVCRFTPTAGGTTDWTVSAAVTGYQTPANAGAVNATIYRYRAESADLSQWEVGYGPYTSAGTVLARTTVLFNSSGTTSKINFTATPQVAVVALKEDLLSIEEANSFTSTQKDRASTNLGTVRAIRVRGFIASGTYTPDANLLYAVIEGVGGGAAGGSCTTGTGTTSAAASGGAAGGFTRRTVSAATIGASQAVTIGAGGSPGAAGNNPGGNGGTTSIGAICSATGGTGGVGSTAGTSGTNSGSAGGVGSGGDLNAAGQASGGGLIISGAPAAMSGCGGSGPYGGGGASVNSGTGQAGSGFGAGGSGAACFTTASPASQGGAGAPGLVIITEYCSQ